MPVVTCVCLSVCNMFVFQVKAAAVEAGDLGKVAQHSTKAQGTLSFGQTIKTLSCPEVRTANPTRLFCPLLYMRSWKTGCGLLRGLCLGLGGKIPEVGIGLEVENY